MFLSVILLLCLLCSGGDIQRKKEWTKNIKIAKRTQFFFASRMAESFSIYWVIINAMALKK